MNMFEITLKNPNNEKQPKIIMERDGLSWKVKKFVIPMDETKPQPDENKIDEPAVEIPTEAEVPTMTEAPTMTEPTTTFDFSGVQSGFTVGILLS